MYMYACVYVKTYTYYLCRCEDVDEGLVDCDLQRLGLAEKPRGRAIRAESLALQLRATLRRTLGPGMPWALGLGGQRPETM